MSEAQTQTPKFDDVKIEEFECLGNNLGSHAANSVFPLYTFFRITFSSTKAIRSCFFQNDCMFANSSTTTNS